MRVVAIGDVMLDFRVPRITSFFLVPSYLTLGLGRPPLQPYVYSPEAVEYLRQKGTRADELLSQSHAPKTIPIPRPGALFDGLRPHLAGDVVFANLESALTRRLHHLGDHAADAAAGQSDRAGGARRQIEHAAADERATIVDGDDHAAAAVGDLELGPERQAAMSGGHGVRIHALAGRGPVAGFKSVIGGHA